MLAHARKHPELRHRELAWRMVDEDVACLSPSTVYRILKEANLVCPWLLLGMDGISTSLAAQAAIETLPRGEAGLPQEKPEVQSDNGSSFIAREFLLVLKEHGLGHHRIKPHCPEENGVIERSFRRLREALEGEELTNLLEAERVLAKLVRWYHQERLHSALG